MLIAPFARYKKIFLKENAIAFNVKRLNVSSTFRDEDISRWTNVAVRDLDGYLVERDHLPVRGDVAEPVDARGFQGGVWVEALSDGSGYEA